MEFKSNGILADISQELTEIQNMTEQSIKKEMRNIGNIIKKNVIECLPTSEKHAKTNSDGTLYTHMKNDVKVTTKEKNGYSYVIVCGGKATAFKWHLVNDGTTRSKPTHFVDNAILCSKPKIDKIIDSIVQGVANG